MFIELPGKTLKNIEYNYLEEQPLISYPVYKILFTTIFNEKYLMYHEEDCCEEVRLVDVCGDMGSLIGNPILQFEESTKKASEAEAHGESGTWTFYKLATIKGSVTLRWLGLSNGYYSESMSFKKLDPSESITRYFPFNKFNQKDQWKQ
jgi:hypothetical protein